MITSPIHTAIWESLVGDDSLTWAAHEYPKALSVEATTDGYGRVIKDPIGRRFIQTYVKAPPRQGASSFMALGPKRAMALLDQHFTAAIEVLDAAGKHIDLATVEAAIKPDLDLIEQFALRTLDYSFGNWRNMVLEFWHRALWRHDGRQIFDVSPGLASRLKATALRGLSTDDLRLPYRTIYVGVPTHAGFTLFDPLSGVHALRGVYIAEANDVPDVDGRPVRGWRLLLWGAPKYDGRVPGPAAAADDALFHYNITLPGGISIDEAVAQMRVRVEREIAADRNHVGERVSDFYRTNWEPIFRWLMNVVVYATSAEISREAFIPDTEARHLLDRHHRAPKGTPKRRALLDSFRAMPARQRQSVTILGRLMPVLEPAPEGAERAQVTVRTLVEGHYQGYWIGTGRSEKIRKWIQPYWRGPDGAPISTPIHRLEE